MTHVTTATYEGTSLLLDSPLPLPLHSRVRIIIEDAPVELSVDGLSGLSHSDWFEQWQKLAQSIEIQVLPEYVGKNSVEIMREMRR
jgi:hypothetical protein